jgi:hypothetical protein
MLALGIGVLLGGGPQSAHPGTWASLYEMSDYNWPYAIRQTTDGGFIAAGFHGTVFPDQFMVMKLDPFGTIEWQGHFDTDFGDRAMSVWETSDGGYVAAGYTHGVIHDMDIWIVKLDGSGQVEWQKAYGKDSIEEVYGIVETEDGGLVAAGQTTAAGRSDEALLLKLDSAGNIEWQKTYGLSLLEYAYSVQTTSDCGFIVAGSTNSSGAGGVDAWLLKLDESGNVIWAKTYGGASNDAAYAVQETSDRGFIVAGDTESFGAGRKDFWILKLDPDGNVEWQKALGGPENDSRPWIERGWDPSYVVGGSTISTSGHAEIWVLKLTLSGDVQWQKSYGNNFLERLGRGACVQPTFDNGIVFGGDSTSLIGGSYWWFLKTDSQGAVGEACPISVSETHATSVETNATVLDTNVVVADSTMVQQETTMTLLDIPVTANRQCTGSSTDPPREVSGAGTRKPFRLAGTTLYWEEGTFNGAETFNLYRGETGDLPSGDSGTCLRLDVPTNSTEDAGTPPPGTCWFYIVTGQNTSGEGPMGFDSAGGYRQNRAPCP